MILILGMTVIGALVISWFGIGLCTEENQRTGFYCVCFTLVLQGVLGWVYRDSWEKDPLVYFIPVLFMQVQTFMSVRISTDIQAAYSPLRKLHPIIPAAFVTGLFTAMMWTFMAAIVDKTQC